MATFPTAAAQRVFSPLSSPSLEDFGVVRLCLNPLGGWSVGQRERAAICHPPNAWPCHGSQLGQALMLRNSLDASHSHCSRSGCGTGLESCWHEAM